MKHSIASKSSLALLTALVTAGLGAAPAQAQTVITCGPLSPLPCDFGVKSLSLQPARNVLKLTARISQAKLPTGEGLFRELLVFIKDGDKALCRESLKDVAVAGNTLNVEIGRTLDCELDQVLAEHQTLNFQLCIGSSEGCLPAIPLASVAYAVHSSFADLTGSAKTATVAAQANWTQRFTADPDLYLPGRLGKGFYDFNTGGDLSTLFPDGRFDVDDNGGAAVFQNGGFIQWTPTDPNTRRLTLLSGDTSGNLRALSDLVVLSNYTFTSGSLTVGSGGIAVANGSGFIRGDSTVVGLLKVNSLGTRFDRRVNNAALIVNGASTIGSVRVRGQQVVAEEDEVLPPVVEVAAGGLTVGGVPTGQTSNDLGASLILQSSLSLSGDLRVPNQRLASVPEPLGQTDIATKTYVDVSADNAEAGAFDVIDRLVENIFQLPNPGTGSLLNIVRFAETPPGSDFVSVSVDISLDTTWPDANLTPRTYADAAYININNVSSEADQLLRDIDEGDALYTQPSDVAGVLLRLDGATLQSGGVAGGGIALSDFPVVGANRLDFNDTGPTEGLCWPSSEASWCIDVANAGRTGTGGNQLHLYGTDTGSHSIVAHRNLVVRDDLTIEGALTINGAVSTTGTRLFARQGNCPVNSRTLTTHISGGVSRRLCAEVQ